MPLLLRAAGQAVGAAEEPQVLAHAEIAVERELLRHVADARARRRRGMAQVSPGDAQGAVAGRQQAAQHAEGGGLARAVGAQQAEHLAPLDRES